MMKSLGTVDDPAGHLAALKTEGGRTLFSFNHTQYYLPAKPTISLHALCWVQNSRVHCVLTAEERIGSAFSALDPGNQTSFNAALAGFGLEAVDLGSPLLLNTVGISKPWGQEIWYTGIEQRGVCTTGSTPLPWLFELAGSHCLGEGTAAPLLLKILDPLPDPVYGDLYFEMHDQKVEVYVVTHVAGAAWPDGIGAIRYGFDPDRIREFDDLGAFKHAYLNTVRDYRRIRAEIDAQFDTFRVEAGIDGAAIISPATLEAWKRRLPPDLNATEVALREAVNRFSMLQQLAVGDVVQVPPFTPHSLQHGVRVVEFQTPHYERYILSFAQKVMTQDHWDTEAAIDKVNWDARFQPEVQMLSSTGQHSLARIADFDRFEVLRLILSAGATFELRTVSYAIVVTVTGKPQVNGQVLAPEAACLVPAAIGSVVVSAGDQETLVLLAQPRQ